MRTLYISCTLKMGSFDASQNQLLRFAPIVITEHDYADLVASDLDQIVEPLRVTCTTKVKANSVKQEFEKQDELKRSAMRAVAALLQIPDAGILPLLFNFFA